MKKTFRFFALLLTAFVFVISFSSCKKSHCTTYYPNGNIQADWYAYDCSVADPNATYYSEDGTCTTCGSGGNNGGNGVDPHDPTIDWTVFHIGTYDFEVDDPLYAGGAPTTQDLESRLALANIDQDTYVDFESGGPANHYCWIYGWAGGYRAATLVDQNLLIGNGKYHYIRNGTMIWGSVTYSNVLYGTKGYTSSYSSHSFPSATERIYMHLE